MKKGDTFYSTNDPSDPDRLVQILEVGFISFKRNSHLLKKIKFYSCKFAHESCRQEAINIRLVFYQM